MKLSATSKCLRTKLLIYKTFEILDLANYMTRWNENILHVVETMCMYLRINMTNKRSQVQSNIENKCERKQALYILYSVHLYTPARTPTNYTNETKKWTISIHMSWKGINIYVDCLDSLIHWSRITYYFTHTDIQNSLEYTKESILTIQIHKIWYAQHWLIQCIRFRIVARFIYPSCLKFRHKRDKLIILTVNNENETIFNAEEVFSFQHEAKIEIKDKQTSISPLSIISYQIFSQTK